jgi:hypothetical protein
MNKVACKTLQRYITCVVVTWNIYAFASAQKSKYIDGVVKNVPLCFRAASVQEPWPGTNPTRITCVICIKLPPARMVALFDAKRSP